MRPIYTVTAVLENVPNPARDVDGRQYHAILLDLGNGHHYTCDAVRAEIANAIKSGSRVRLGLGGYSFDVLEAA